MKKFSSGSPLPKRLRSRNLKSREICEYANESGPEGDIDLAQFM